ncbi:MAG: YdcF family protein [Alphaproteobacteria bacterium]|nr:YdcF family protein [Alphaproteobacteria bacterium]
MSRRSRLRAQRRRRLIGAIIFATVPIGWAVGLWIFSANLPQPLEQENITRMVESRADTILVFTGGNNRLNTGFKLLKNNHANQLFISGVHRGVDVVSLIKNFSDANNPVLCCVTLGYNADDTYGNAKESLSWIRANKYQRVILVTSSYHMPRSLYYLRKADFPLSIYSYPVLSEYADNNRWGDLPGTRALIISEYNKYLITVISGFFGRIDYDNPPSIDSFTPLP